MIEAHYGGLIDTAHEAILARLELGAGRLRHVRGTS